MPSIPLHVVNIALLSAGPFVVIANATHLTENAKAVRLITKSFFLFFVLQLGKTIGLALLPFTESETSVGMARTLLNVFDAGGVLMALRWGGESFSERDLRLHGVAVGLGWAAAEVMTSDISTIIGGIFGADFEWIHLQRSLYSSLSILSCISLASGVLMMTRQYNWSAKLWGLGQSAQWAAVVVLHVLVMPILSSYRIWCYEAKQPAVSWLLMAIQVVVASASALFTWIGTAPTKSA